MQLLNDGASIQFILIYEYLIVFKHKVTSWLMPVPKAIVVIIYKFFDISEAGNITNVCEKLTFSLGIIFNISCLYFESGSVQLSRKLLTLNAATGSIRPFRPAKRKTLKDGNFCVLVQKQKQSSLCSGIRWKQTISRGKHAI